MFVVLCVFVVLLCSLFFFVYFYFVLFSIFLFFCVFSAVLFCVWFFVVFKGLVNIFLCLYEIGRCFSVVCMWF